ncbi:YqkE family protein [Neobacillus sp. D3-1R]|uniref:YqkE family protein n=1 Tax=Neobacillus sp. D3-1R TaxID=3445778 RepID=UPI003F9F4DB2
MKKQKQQKHQSTKPKKDESAITLGDFLNQDLMKQLKEKQQELKASEEKKLQEEEARKREERRLKEKNKTFEELLNESNTDWRSFK